MAYNPRDRILFSIHHQSNLRFEKEYDEGAGALVWAEIQAEEAALEANRPHTLAADAVIKIAELGE